MPDKEVRDLTPYHNWSIAWSGSVRCVVAKDGSTENQERLRSEIEDALDLQIFWVPAA